MNTDAEFLRRYVEQRDERAFAELVQRHLSLVYGAALRQSGDDRHHAEEATQIVFTLLARKAATLQRHPSLPGWLYTTTHYTVSDLRRREWTRRQRETEAHAMHEHSPGYPDNLEWERLRPVLDQAMQDLGERDRVAVLARFFAGLPFADIGVQLRVSEDAARMRVERALEKLRRLLANRGIKSTGAALGIILTNEAAASVPSGLAASIATTALTGVGATGAAAGSALAIMGMSKIQVGIGGAVMAGMISALTWQHAVNADLREQLARAQPPRGAVAERPLEKPMPQKPVSIVAKGTKTAAEWADLQRTLNTLRLSMLEMDQQEDRRRRTLALEAVAQAPLREPVYSSGEVDVGVRSIRRIEPLRGMVAGEAAVEFIVDARGSVQQAKVLRATNESHAALALKAVQTHDFFPAQKDGRAVTSRVDLVLPVVALPPRETPAWGRPIKASWF